MRIICPTYDYNEALSALSLTTLNERRESTCVRLQNENHPSHIILPKLEEVQHDYHLKSAASYRLRPICNTKRSQDFITFKY